MKYPNEAQKPPKVEKTTKENEFPVIVIYTWVSVGYLRETKRNARLIIKKELTQNKFENGGEVESHTSDEERDSSVEQVSIPSIQDRLRKKSSRHDGE